MTDAYETGAFQAFNSPTLPAWQRAYYESQLLDTIRMRSIMVPYCKVVENFAALNTKQITFSEIFDMEPNWNPMAESTLWKKGQYLDSRQMSINLEWYWDIVKWFDHNDVFTYLNAGDFSGIVREKLGQSLVDTLDILARNAFLTHPTPSYASTATSRATLTSAMLFDPDIAEDIRVQLQEAEVPGLATNDPDSIAQIVCLTTPRVIHDIRTAAGSAWLDVNNYQGTSRKFTGEVGQWAGVRFVMTNRLRLRNAGAAIAQTTLDGATAEGQGSAATVDTIWTPGQSTATRYITVAAVTDLAVGDYVTIHSQPLGTAVLESDGTQETRRIVSIDAGNKRIAFDKPLLKAHATGDYLTKALNVHASIFMGGPGVVYAVAERPNVIVPPKIDDVQLVNRLGWRGMLKFQLWNPVYYQVHYSAGSE